MYGEITSIVEDYGFNVVTMKLLHHTKCDIRGLLSLLGNIQSAVLIDT
jgi:nucleoside diphosphate kinase